MAMYFEERGNNTAPTIVFIHGGGISGWMWEKQIEAFKDYHCIIPHLPEHGKSIEEKPISITDCVNRIAELILSKANGKKAHVIGHSLGGKIIVELLSKNPQVVDRAIIASALFRPMLLLNVTCNSFCYNLTIMMLKSKKILQLQADQFEFPNDFYKQNFITENQHLTADSLNRIYSELYKHLKLPINLSEVNVPTLIIAGNKEPKAMKESVKDLVHAIPNSKGILIKNAKHNFPWKESDKFNLVIRSWLNDEAINFEFIDDYS